MSTHRRRTAGTAGRASCAVSAILVVSAVLLLFTSLASPAQAQAPDTTLSLTSAVRLALASHPAVAVARAGEAEAASRVSEAVAARLPQLTTQGALTRFELPMIVAPLHGFDPTRPPTFDRTLVQGNGQLGYVLFDGGARGARIGGLRAEEGAAEANVSAAVMRLTAEVTRAYLGVLSTDGRLQAQRQSLAALEAERARVSRALEVGRAARVDLLRVEAALAQAEAEQIATATDLDVAVAVLARLVGLDPEHAAPGALQSVQLTDTTAAADREALLHRATTANPDLETARRRRDAAASAHRAARAAWFPRLELGGGYLVYGSGAGDYTSEWQGALRFAYPLFQGGARQAAVSAASARADGAAEQYRFAELELENMLDRALASVRETRARVHAMARAVEHLTEVVRIEQLALEAGAGTQSDFLRADADLRRSRAALIEARHGEILARVELLRITGELTPEGLAELVESVR